MTSTNLASPAYEIFWSDPKKYASISLVEVSKYLHQNNRSSTTFPIFASRSCISVIRFLSYWIRKHGNSVVLRVTARDVAGSEISCFWNPITKLAAYEINAQTLFPIDGHSNCGFVGTVELEFYSKEPPLFTYPAASIFYESAETSAVVHGCVRSYNVNEHVRDYALCLPQTGFDINFGNNRKNYICFTGGKRASYEINITLSGFGAPVSKPIKILNTKPGQLHIIFIEEVFDNTASEGAATISIEHNLDVFPRFYAGTLTDFDNPTLTHSFYDTSEKALAKHGIEENGLRCDNYEAYKYFDSAFMIPLLPRSNYSTKLKVYGKNLTFTGEINCRMLSSSGRVLVTRSLSGVEVDKWSSINELDPYELLGYPRFHEEPAAMLVGFKSGGKPFPNRFKLGLNIGKSRGSWLGTNICFAPAVLYKNFLSKPFCRRWFPVGGPPNFVGYVHATSFEMAYVDSDIKITAEFFDLNGEKLVRCIDLNANGTLVIDPSKDVELQRFLNGEVGWCYITAETYLIDSYFISTLSEQIGGDHSF